MSDNKKEINHDSLVIQNLMRTDHGRNYMWNKLQEYGVFANIFNNDPVNHAYASGLRAAGLAFVSLT